MTDLSGAYIEERADELGIGVAAVRRGPEADGFVDRARRRGVGRMFTWLLKCRRPARDYEGIATSSNPRVHLALIRLRPGRLARLACCWTCSCWVEGMGVPADGHLPKEIHGHPVAADTGAASGRPGEPAFVSRPAGAPPYHGFPILDDVDVDGFRLGMITDFEAEATAEGDSFVVAPDGTQAGLVWEVSPRGSFEEVYPADADRWGVWAATFPFPMSSRENARRNLLAVLPELRQRWEHWRARFSDPGPDP